MAKKMIHKTPSRSMPMYALVLIAACFFLLLCLNIDPVSKTMAVLLMAATLVFGIFRFRMLQEKMGLQMLTLLAMVLMGCVSVFYAVWGDYAQRGAVYLLVSLCLALLLQFLFAKDAAPGEKIATVLEGACALFGLFSIDLLSTHWLSTPLLSILGLWTQEYSEIIFVENGVRMNSLIGSPNVFAGCMGIGVLLSLSLVLSTENKKFRRLHLCCLYVNALAFVLAFSMGATGSIAAAFLVYLLLERKQRRSDLLLLMVKTFVLVLVSVVPISMTSLETWDGFQPIPLLCTVIGAVLLCLADQFTLRRAAEVLRKRGKLLLICVAVVLALLLCFAAAACLWTGPADLSAGEGLRRAAYPAPGAYTVTAQGGEGVSVTIESQNRQEAMMHVSTVLYTGELSQAAFEVPEDSLVVYFNFTAGQDTSLESVTCQSAGGTVSVPLGYKLLPSFIANRLQGLLANQNAIQRTVFFRDGMKLFRQSPIIGKGLGAFEMAYSSVQEFYYETKYVHNHYVQTLLENGIIGLVLFVALLVLSAINVLGSRRKDDCHPLVPALGALLVFMAIHAAVEVVFSSGFYLPLAFGVFVLIGQCCEDTVSGKWLNKKVRTGILLGAAVFFFIFRIMICCNIYAQKQVKKTPTYDTLVYTAKLDLFDWPTHINNYIISMTDLEDAPQEIRDQAEILAQRMERVESRWTDYRLTHYYLEQGRLDKAMEKAEKHIRYNASNEGRWNELFALLAAYETDDPEFRDGVQRLADFLVQWDAENMGNIQLDEASQALLDRVLAQ